MNDVGYSVNFLLVTNVSICTMTSSSFVPTRGPSQTQPAPSVSKQNASKTTTNNQIISPYKEPHAAVFLVFFKKKQQKSTSSVVFCTTPFAFPSTAVSYLVVVHVWYCPSPHDFITSRCRSLSSTIIISSYFSPPLPTQCTVVACKSAFPRKGFKKTQATSFSFFFVRLFLFCHTTLLQHTTSTRRIGCVPPIFLLVTGG